MKKKQVTRRKWWLAIVLCMLVTSVAVAQNYQVKGKVTDASSGEAVGFVTVFEKGTKRFATTDENGNYELSVSGVNAVVVFQMMGYQTVEQIVAGNTLNASMQLQAQRLDEVLVVAYGSAKKSSYTGSATTVSKEKIEKLQVSNVTQALQGMSSGVQVLNDNGIPGSTPSVIIRGIGSMNASSAPLYVVDGIAFNGSLNSLNPNDVESMTILKDAAAASLYGSRAANGVIMITTKSGKGGKNQINFKATFGFSDLAVQLPRTLNPTEYYEMTWEALYNFDIDQGQTPNKAAQNASDKVVQTIKTNPFDTPRPVGLDGKIDPAASLLFEGDWSGELIKPRLRQDYILDFIGNSENEKTNYFLSFGYANDKGVFTVQEFERYSGRVNLSSKMKNWLEVGTNIGFSHTEQNNPNVNLQFLRSIPTVYPVYEWDYAAGAYAKDENGNKIYDYGEGTRVSWQWWNPLAEAEYNRAYTYRENMTSRSFIELTFLPELKFRTNFSLDFRLNSYHGYASSSQGISAEYKGEANKETDRIFAYTVNNLLTYDKKFGDDHHINILAGQEAHAYRYNVLSGRKQTFPAPGLYELVSASKLLDAYSSEDNYRLLSWLARAEYDYKNRYYVSGSFRTDGSSRFHPNNRWGNFWSVGASWRISEEVFMKDITWVNNLKLKASYGAVGNDQVSYYAYQGLYATGQNNYTRPGILMSALPNPELRWESNLQLNTGIDFRIFNHIDGSIEWFRRTSKDLLFTQPMAISTGFGGITRNVGTIRNSGIELQLTANAIEKKNFRWVVDLNLTHYVNEIVNLPQEVMIDGYNRWVEGRSRYDFWLPEWAGVNPVNGKSQWWKNEFLMANGQYVLNDNGEKIVTGRYKTESYDLVNNDDNKIYAGSAIPDLFGGFINTFYFFGFDASIFIYYSIGGKLYDNDYAGMMSYRDGYAQHEDILNRWTPENTYTDIPRMSKTDANYMNITSTRFLYENSFVRLRNVTLGYTLPQKWTEKVNINQVRLYVQGDNLLTFGAAKQRGSDPEQSFGGTTGYRFPTLKTVSFGVQVSF